VPVGINGTKVNTSSTNLPTGGGRQLGAIVKFAKTLGAGARNLHVDYFEVGQTFGTAR